MSSFRVKISDGTNTVDFKDGSDSFLVEAGMGLRRPRLNQSIITNPDSDGASLANAHFGERTITLTTKITGSSQSDLKDNIRTINRLLNDAEERTLAGFGSQVFLEYQWGDTDDQSVFYDILRGDLILPANFMQSMVGKAFVIPRATISLTTQPYGRFTNQIESTKTLDNSQGARLIKNSYVTGQDATNAVNGADWEGQTFTTTEAYTAIGAAILGSVNNAGDDPGDMTLELYATLAGVPTGSAIATGTIDGDGVPQIANFAWLRVDFDSSVALDDATLYALVAHNPGAVDYFWRRDLGGGLADGNAVTSANSGTDWASSAPADFLFAVYAVDAKTNYQDVTVAASYGDVPSRMAIEVSQNNATGSKKIWIGKRSGTRQSDDLWIEAEDFSSFTNIIGGAHVFEEVGNEELADDPSSEFSQTLNVIPTGAAIAANSEVARWNFAISALPRGQFRVLVRAKAIAEDPNDFDHTSWGFGYSYGGTTKAPAEANGEYFQVAADSTWEILDLGILNIPPVAESDVADNASFELRIFQYATELLAQGELYQWSTDYIFLLPIDEGNVIVADVAADDFLLSDGITRPNNVFLLAQEEAPHFDGTVNSHMTAGAIHNAAAKFWMSFWFKFDSLFDTDTAAGQDVFGKRLAGDDTIRLQFSSNGAIFLIKITPGGGTVISITSTEVSWPAGEWHHVIFSISSSAGARLIIDNGTAVTDADTSALPNGGTFTLGQRLVSLTTGFVGIIANVSTGTDDLTTSEEEGLFNGVIPADATEIWLMDEGTGTNVANTGTSGSGNDGTLGAAVTWENHIRINNSGIQNGTIASFPDYVGNPPSLGRESTRIYVLRDDDDTVTLPIAIERQPQFLVQ